MDVAPIESPALVCRKWACRQRRAATGHQLRSFRRAPPSLPNKLTPAAAPISAKQTGRRGVPCCLAVRWDSSPPHYLRDTARTIR